MLNEFFNFTIFNFYHFKKSVALRYAYCLCDKQHVMPEEGLPLNQSLQKLLLIKPAEVYRSQAVESFKLELKEMLKKMESISYCLKTNRSDQMKQHCASLKNDVKMASDEIIQKIKVFKQETIEEIEKFETESIASKEIDPVIREKLMKTSEEYDLFHREWTQYLKQTKIDDKTIADAAQKAIQLKQRGEQEIKELQNSLFEWIPEFRKQSTTKLNKSIIGCLINPKSQTYSVLTNSQFKDLLKLCQFSPEQKLKLLYRASEDGFEAPTFHYYFHRYY